jgi:hypothetical protein
VDSAKLKKLIKPTIAIVVGLSLVLIYYYIDPVGSAWAHFVPKCPIKSLTGFDCPSCGIQRALHALFNGNFKVAFWVNPFLTFVLPYIVALIYTALSSDRFSQRIKPYVQHNLVTYTYLAIYVIWWVVRNTTWWLDLAAKWQS